MKATKALVICSTLNLDYPYGATPYIWQFLKALYEVGCDVIAIPYRGDFIRSIWWRGYPNPCKTEGEIYARASKLLKTGVTNAGNTYNPAQKWVRRKWRNLIFDVLQREKDVDFVLMVGVPMNHLTGLAEEVRRQFKIPFIYYDVDFPISLPEHGGFSHNFYVGANVSEFDAVVTPSEDMGKLKEMGAQRAFTLHFGVDPDVYQPIAETKQDIDVFFFATNDAGRQTFINLMIAEPSKKLTSKFLISGTRFSANLGNATLIPMVLFNSWRLYACRSKINLNIGREIHASTRTSISRPFELAAMGCCVVSAPYRGLENWFKLGTEMIVAEDLSRVTETYQWLLSDDEARKRMGEAARQRVLRDHTVRERVKLLLDFINKL